MKSSLVFIVCCVCIVSLTLAAEAPKDLNKARLEAAKSNFDQEVAKLRLQMVEALKEKEAVLQRTGDLVALKKIQAERPVFEKTGDLPTTVPTGKYVEACMAARVKLEQAYDVAIRAYTREKSIVNADLITKELEAFRKAGPPHEPPIFLRNLNSNMVIGTQNGATASGTQVVQGSDANGKADGSWTVIPADDGWFFLRNAQSGAYLTVPNGGGRGAALIIAPRAEGKALGAQQWKYMPSKEVTGFAQIVNRSSGMFISVNNRSGAEGASILQWTPHGGRDQLWKSQDVKQ